MSPKNSYQCFNYQSPSSSPTSLQLITFTYPIFEMLNVLSVVPRDKPHKINYRMQLMKGVKDSASTAIH